MQPSKPDRHCWLLPVLPLLIPPALLVHGLIAQQVIGAAIDALRGDYAPFGVPANPWLDLLPPLGGLLAGYLILTWGALQLAQIVRGGWRVLPWLLILPGAACYFALTIRASLAYLSFGDFLTGGIAMRAGLELIVVAPVLALGLNSVLLFRAMNAARDSSSRLIPHP